MGTLKVFGLRRTNYTERNKHDVINASLNFEVLKFLIITFLFLAKQ